MVIKGWGSAALIVAGLLVWAGMAAGQEEVNLALNKRVTASSEHPANPASRAVNGTSSHWQISENNGEIWLVVDMGQPTAFNTFNVSIYGYPSFAGYAIQYSDDMENWKDAYVLEGDMGSVSSVGTGIFPEVTARYVRFYGFVPNRSAHAGLRSFELYRQNPETAVHLASLAVPSLGMAADNPTQTVFELEVPDGMTRLTVHTQQGVDGQRVKINGVEAASAEIDLMAEGDHATRQQVDVVVTARNGRHAQTYSLVFLLPIPDEVRLKEIRVSPIGNVIASPDAYTYEIHVPAGIRDLTVQAVPGQEGQAVRVGDTEAATAAVRIPESGRAEASVTVTAADASLERSYTLTFLLPPDERADYELLYEDRFDGEELNLDNWFYRTDTRFGGLNLPRNVRVAQDADGRSSLFIDFKHEDFNGLMRYTGGGVISRQLFGYGYYEIRAKLYGASMGVHQSFWSMGITNPADEQNKLVPKFSRVLEIDGFEVDSISPGILSTAGHWYLPNFHGVGSEKFDVDTTEWFTMGYEWLPGQVNFYVNGVKLRSMPFNKFYAPQNLWLTALATPEYYGGAVPPEPGAAMQVEYFRYYGARHEGANLLGNGSFEYNMNTVDLQHPLNWIETGNESASRVISADSRSGIYALEHALSIPYSVETRQILYPIANGTYRLSAWVKSSGGQEEAVMKVSGFGGDERIAHVPATDEWRLIEIDGVQVMNNRAEVAFLSIADKDQWIRVDDVSFSIAGDNGTSANGSRREAGAGAAVYAVAAGVVGAMGALGYMLAAAKRKKRDQDNVGGQ